MKTIQSKPSGGVNVPGVLKWKSRSFSFLGLRFSLIITAMLLVSAVPAWSTTYYVRTDGNNSNNGLTNTPSGAWSTIDWAADHVLPGDIVRVQAGTYLERVTPGVNGTSTTAMVTFVADGTVTVRGWDMANRNFIRVIGFIIDTDAGGSSKSSSCVLLGGTNNYLEFWNNTFRDSTYNGIRMGVNDRINNSLVIGNIFHAMGIGNYSGVAVGTRGDHNLIAYNEIYNIDPDVFGCFGTYNRWINNYSHDILEQGAGHPDIFQTGTSVSGFAYNLFEAHFQAGVGNTGNEHTAQISNGQSITGTPGAMTENIFRRNILHNVSSGTVGINQTSVGTVTYTRFYHNTTAGACRNYPSNRYGLTWYGVGTFNGFIHNNIEYQSWGDAATANLEVYYVTGGLTADYNLAYDPDGPVTFSSIWNSQAHPRSNVNPALVDFANDNFTLGAASGAIGMGGPLTTVSGSGTGTTFNVAAGGGGFFRGDDAFLSQYGGNLVAGDTITVGNDTVTVATISGNAITVTAPFTWANGESVFFGASATPDIGAYPYRAGGYALTASYSQSGGTVTVTPSDANMVRFVVCYENGIPTLVDDSSPYTFPVGSGAIDVRVYPLYASKTLWVQADPVLDSDGDGLLDAWEVLYFGSIADPRAQPGVDADGDGFDNLAEQSAGTSPMDSNSRLVIISQNFSSNSFNVQWTAAANKIYQIDFSHTLTNWSPAATLTNGSATTLQWTDDGSLTGGIPSGRVKRFYRVRVP